MVLPDFDHVPGAGDDRERIAGRGRGHRRRRARAGMPLPTVQRLAGHASIQTTLTYYNWASDEDLRRSVATLRENEAKSLPVD